MARQTVKMPGVTITKEVPDLERRGAGYTPRKRVRARAVVHLEIDWHMLAEALGSKAWRNKTGRARACNGLVHASLKKVEQFDA